jgi:hypothetical protein
MVIRPDKAQAMSSQPGAPTNRADSAEVMKIPEPIIDPTTIIAASTVPSSRTNDPESGLVSLISDFVGSDMNPHLQGMILSYSKPRMSEFVTLDLGLSRVGDWRLVSLLFHKSPDIRDRLVERLAPPVGERGIKRGDQFIDKERGGFFRRPGVGADLREITVMN